KILRCISSSRQASSLSMKSSLARCTRNCWPEQQQQACGNMRSQTLRVKPTDLPRIAVYYLRRRPKHLLFTLADIILIIGAEVPFLGWGPAPPVTFEARGQRIGQIRKFIASNWKEAIEPSNRLIDSHPWRGRVKPLPLVCAWWADGLSTNSAKRQVT